MINFKTFISEALNPEDFLDRQDKEVDLFSGRMQPIHKGHEAILKSMNNPVVALVKGKKSSEDKVRNPLSAEYQEKLIKKLLPGVKVIIVDTGYIPEINNELRKEGLETIRIYAGEDRFKGYQGQIKSFNSQMPEEKQMSVTYKKTERLASATDVRNAIKSDDIEAFKSLMPKKLHKEWDDMRKLIS